MNFLSHDFILPEGAEPVTRVGTTLPDLWVLLPRRPLPFAVVRGLRADGDLQGRQLADGIEGHLRADAAFHGHEEFQRRMGSAAGDLRQALPELKFAQLAAHVAVEMVLDRFLIDRDPSILDRHYAAFTPEAVDAACTRGAAEQQHRDLMRQILDRYSSSRFLADYRTADGMVMRWLRSLGRSPFSQNGPLDERLLAGLMERWCARFAAGSEELLDSVREAVASWPEPS
jgi:hypothetical protein